MARQYVNQRFPKSPAELAKALADPAAAAELFGGGAEAWARFDAEYAKASPMLAKLAGEQAQVELQKALQAGGQHPPRGFAAPGAAGASRNRMYNGRAPGANLDKHITGDYPLAQFTLAADHRHELGPARDLRMAIRNDMSERVPASGGLLVPENQRAEILMAALELSIVRRCRPQMIPMDSLRIPIPTIDDTSHAGGSVLGGVSAFWTEEGASIAQSAPKFGRVVLEAKKLSVFTLVPSELLSDASPALEEWMQRVLPDALAFYEDLAFLTGTGVGEPQGILNAPGAVVVNRTTSSTILFADIVGMFTRLLPVASKGAVWICSPDAVGQLMQMAITVAGKDGTNATTTPIAPPAWLMTMNAVEDIPETLLGRPLFITEKVGPLGSKGDLILSNWSYYLLGDRQEIQAAVSEEYAFANDMTAYRWIERADGRAWLQSPITPANGGPTLSPYVILQ